MAVAPEGFGGTCARATMGGKSALERDVERDYGSPAAGGLSTLSHCVDVLACRRMHLSDVQVTALTRQLNALLADEGELKEAGLAVSETSLDGLIDFLAAHRGLAHPNLLVTRNGYFAASWSPHRRSKLTIIFEPSGAGEWMAIDLDPAHRVHEKGRLPDIPHRFADWISA